MKVGPTAFSQAIVTLVLAASIGCGLHHGGSSQSENSNASAPKPPPDKQASKPAQTAAGSIEVTSTPSGANILLIATDEGGAGEPQPRGITPTTINGLAPGKYTVHLEKTGYRFSQKKIEVKAGSTVKVAATLRKS